MTREPPKDRPGLDEEEKAFRMPEDENERPLTPEEDTRLDAWFERNKDALKASIEEGRKQFERGECSPLDDVMARVRAKLADEFKN